LPTARDLQRQINTVKNQARVFSALQTVSSVKFRKAEARVRRARPYAENVEQMMRDVAGNASEDLPILTGREVERVAVCSFTADRGLAGGFNAQVLRRTVRLRGEKDPGALQVASGRKAVAFFRFRRVELAEVFTGFTDNPTYDKAREIGRSLTRLFDDKEADEVYLVYNRFESALNQRPVVMRVLPVTDEDEEPENGASSYMDYVPDAETVLKRLVPRYVETMVWQALLEGAAGEHGARMTAMKNATDNANDLVRDLTLQMNKARQAQITQEILEIVGGAEALSAG
jgi:F-type H+-transporting ATPase subunit gamma